MLFNNVSTLRASHDRTLAHAYSPLVFTSFSHYLLSTRGLAEMPISVGKQMIAVCDVALMTPAGVYFVFFLGSKMLRRSQCEEFVWCSMRLPSRERSGSAMGIEIQESLDPSQADCSKKDVSPSFP